MANTDKNNPSDKPKVATQDKLTESRRKAVMDAYRNLLSIEDSVRNLREDLSATEDNEEGNSLAGVSPAAEVSSGPVVPERSGVEFIERIDMHKVGLGIRRRLWLILGMGIVFALAGSILSGMLLRTYQAESVLLFEDTPAQNDAWGINPRPLTRQTIAEMIKAPKQMQAVQQALGLNVAPEVIGSWVDVFTNRASNLIKIVAVTDNPELSTQIANTLAVVAVSDSKQRYADSSKRAKAYLEEEVQVAGRRLDVLNREMAKFKSESGIVAFDLEEKEVASSANQANTALEAAELNYQGLLVQYENLQRELASMPDTIVRYEYEQNPMKARVAAREMALLEAKTRFGPENPKVLMLEEELSQLRAAMSQQTLDESRERVFEKNYGKEQLELELVRLRGDLKAAKQKKDGLIAVVQATGDAVENAPQVELQYQRMNRLAQDSETQVKELSAALRVADAAEDRERSDITVYQSAPGAQPKRSFFARFLPTIGFLFGAGIALAFALVAELRDKRLRTPSQVKRSYNAPCLASIPEIKGLTTRNAEDKTLYFIRGLTEKIARSFKGAPAQTMAFTSSVADEGKSTIAYHFACYHQRLGLKTAYLSFDWRDNSYLRQGPRPNQRIEAYLKDDHKLEDLCANGKVDIFVAGKDHGMKELIKGKKMHSLLSELKRNYDVVVIDAPGLIEDDYGVNLCQMADATLFVIGSSVTKSDATDAALSELDERGLRPTGLILNRMKSRYIDDPRIQAYKKRQGGWSRWFGR